MRIAFAPLPRPVLFEDGADALLPLLPAMLSGWTWRKADDTGEPAFRVGRHGDDYGIDAPWNDAPVHAGTSFLAAANLAVDLVEAWLAAFPDRPAFHCAAAELDGGLVLFSGPARAGKSTLAAYLGARGHRVLADDLVILDTDGGCPGGMSLGQAPRLRLPLPPAAPPALHALARDRTAARNGDYAYLRLDPALAPHFGLTLPIRALVLLERRGEGGAVLAPLEAGNGALEMLDQRLSPALSPAALMPALETLLATVPAFRLHYADLDAAHAALTRPGALDAPRRAAEAPPAPGTRPARDGVRMIWADGVSLHRIGDGGFLVRAGDDDAFRLDPLAMGIWSLLDRPTSAAEAAAIIQGAFPDVPPDRIDGDVVRFLAALAARGLVRPAPDA